MRIGVDATAWQNKRGYGRHARALFSTLVGLDRENQYTFFMDSTEGMKEVPAEAEVKLVQAASPTSIAAAANGHRSFQDMWQMSRAMSTTEFDLLIFPTVYSYVPVFSRARKIVMIHDIIAETFPHLTLPSRASQLFWKIKVALGRWQADAIVTVSSYSRRGIIEHFHTPPDAVFIVGEASDPVFRKIDNPQLTSHLQSLGLSIDDYNIIYVGGFGPHKNLEALVDTFAKISAKDAYSNSRLVMVGEYKKEIFHTHFSTLKNQIKELGIVDKVVFTGFLPDEELAILLNLSTVLVLPSLMEGFGLPAVEAAACGCPVIATTASPLPELLGNGGLYIDPMKPEALESALAQILGSEDLRKQMGKDGLKAAGSLTWETAARQMMDVIHKIAPQ